ncbi:MAG TPA: IS1182 family transposase [Dehalococcoidia bacterium]|jgi:transposase|nr:IS1182 family transposase [Dehalococcoidia bacterium]
MRHYHPYTPDQAALLPQSFRELISASDPVHAVLRAVEQLDLGAIHEKLRAVRGRPPYHPRAMVGLLLYGACRGIYSSRRLQAACGQDVSFMYLMGRLQPDFHTICEFRQRFETDLKGLFSQVLELCRRAGLVRLGHVALDGTKVRANASKHKAMSYERLLSKRKSYEEEIDGWFRRAERDDADDDASYGPDNDGWSLPEGWEKTLRRLGKIEAAQERLEEEAKEKVVQAGKDPSEAKVHPRAQANFTDPESRIMHTPDGFQQSYNAQAAVDAESQVIVAQEVSQAPPDVQRLRPMLEQIIKENRRVPRELSADAGYASEANFQALDDAGIYAVVALRRYHRDEPPDADPAPARSSRRWPHRNLMREVLRTADGKAKYKLRKQTVEPVFGQIKAARGFRQFLRRGLSAVEAEWSLVCTAHNLLKLGQAWQTA